MKKMRNIRAHCLQVISLLCISCAATAADLGQDKARLLVDINALGDSISSLEQNTLLPAATRVEVFLSLAPELQYTPKSVTLSVDGKQLVTHTYSKAEIKSLRFGALHTVWQGNLTAGTHQLQASFSGIDRKDEPVQNTAKVDFDKDAHNHSLELKITSAEENGKEAVFSVKDWGDK